MIGLTVGEGAIGQRRGIIGVEMDRLGEIGDRVVILADACVGDAAGVIGFGAVRVALDDVGQGGDIRLRRLPAKPASPRRFRHRWGREIAVFASRKAQRRQQKCREDGAPKQCCRDAIHRNAILEMQVLDQSV